MEKRWTSGMDVRAAWEGSIYRENLESDEQTAIF